MLVENWSSNARCWFLLVSVQLNKNFQLLYFTLMKIVLEKYNFEFFFLIPGVVKAQLQMWKKCIYTKAVFFPFTFTSPMQLPLISSKKKKNHTYTNNKNFEFIETLTEGSERVLLFSFIFPHTRRLTHPCNAI